MAEANPPIVFVTAGPGFPPAKTREPSIALTGTAQEPLPPPTQSGIVTIRATSEPSGWSETTNHVNAEYAEWDFTFPLAVGINTLRVEATDAVGNAGHAEIQIARLGMLERGPLRGVMRGAMQ